MWTESSSEDNRSWPKIAGPLRRLTINSASVLLSRLESTLKQVGQTTFSKDVEGFRVRNHGLDFLLRMVHRPGDPPINTQMEKIKFLAYGSPKLRGLLAMVRDKVLLANEGMHGKLLITEQIPVSCWFWHIAMEALHIPTATLHAGLTSPEKTTFVETFNKPGHAPKVFILPYLIGSQGTNMHGSCSDIASMCTADQDGIEIQGYGRCIRVRKPHSS